MSYAETDRLFCRGSKINTVDIAGKELLTYLSEIGVLPSNITLYLQSVDPNERSASFADAIRAAIHGNYNEVPEWAQPGYELPGVLEIPYVEYMREQQAVLDTLDSQYYSMLALVRTLRGDSGDATWRKRAFTISHMTWARILRQIHLLSKERLDYLDTFKSQTEAGMSGVNLKHAKRHTVTEQCIGDDVLYDMISNNLIGVRSYTKGIGKVAVMGIGAMLCIEGGHGDLYLYAEQLADYVADKSVPLSKPSLDE